MSETAPSRQELETALGFLEAAQDGTQYTELRNRLLAKCQNLAANLQ
jgi:hypothetical protein